MPKALCPCCGTTVGGFTKSGAAKGATRLKEVIDGLTELREGVGASISEASASKLQAVIDDGQQTYEHYLDHVHKRARPGTTPDIMALNGQSSRFFDSASMIVDAVAGGPRP